MYKLWLNLQEMTNYKKNGMSSKNKLLKYYNQSSNVKDNRVVSPLKNYEETSIYLFLLICAGKLQFEVAFCKHVQRIICIMKIYTIVIQWIIEMKKLVADL